MQYGGYIYILFNKPNGTLYIGVTSDLPARMIEHRLKKYPKCFSARYDCTKLGYYETFPRIEMAIEREKQIKGGSRTRKLELIMSQNAGWDDLYQNVLDETITAEHWIPEMVKWSREEIRKFNRKLRSE